MNSKNIISFIIILFLFYFAVSLFASEILIRALWPCFSSMPSSTAIFRSLLAVAVDIFLNSRR